MKEKFDQYRAQIEKIRAKSGPEGDSSSEVAGIHRATLLGLNLNFSLEKQLGELSGKEAAELSKLASQVDNEIDSRFQT